MPNNPEAVVFYCPSCGASIAMEGEQGTCAFCGTAIERSKQTPPQRPATPPEPRPAVWSASSVTVVRAERARPKRSSSCLGTLIMVVMLAVVGVAVAIAVSGSQLISAISNGPVNLPAVLKQVKLGPITEMAAVLPRDGKGGDLVVYVYGVGDSRYSVALIDGASQAPRWQSQPLSKEAYQGLLVAGQDMIYLTDQDQLLALRLSDGTPAWQTALAVEPQTGCEECIRLVGGHVLVLEKNSGLQAFEARSGKLAWSTRLAENTRRLPIVGDRVITTRPSEDSQGSIIAFLDASTGKPTLQLVPHCPEHNTFSEFERPRYDTPMLFSQDGQTMYTMYGFFAQCAQAFDLASGQPRWEHTLDDGLMPSSWYYNTALLTDKALYVNQNQLIWALDTADGSVRTVIEEQEYNLRPLAERDGTLIVLAAPTWDSQRQALWGLDATTGERRWQQPLQAHSLRQGSSSGDWDWQLTSKGLVVVQVLRDEARLIVETLNPRTGASSAKQETELADLHMPSLYQPMWTEDVAYLKLDSQIYAVDLATGKMVFQL